MGYDNGVGPPQPGQRLAQQAARKHATASKRLPRVNQHDLKIPVRPTMLHPVVKNENRRLGMPLERPGRSTTPVAIDHHRRAAGGEQCLLIAQSRRSRFVSPKQNARPLVLQAGGEPTNHRRLARPARGDVPHADRRPAQRMNREDFRIVEPIARPHDRGINRLGATRGDSQRPRRDGAVRPIHHLLEMSVRGLLHWPVPRRKASSAEVKTTGDGEIARRSNPSTN